MRRAHRRHSQTSRRRGVIIADFLRFLDQLNVVVVRGEWIAGIDNACSTPTPTVRRARPPDE